MYNHPTIAEFKAYFTRDFPYGTDPETSILDTDINKAFGQTRININPNLFADQESFSIGFMLLAAHYLVVDIRMSSQGIGGQFNFTEQSKSVGSVSQSFAIPQKILENPYFAMLVKTNYGAKYLELVLPQLAGAIFPVHGRTLP